ncbi:RES protein [Arthrobacter sp. TPD3018]|uniref:RES domain-containing protein n=1 Tax=Alterirhizorhabdus solaris TaxID=2529389 RepID=A0A558RDJ8_9SPHN|nr:MULTISPECIES: RES family NAD+ phosphorylase [Bacteria]MBI0477267.1 RES domain-containing protein [Sphingomonas sp. MA1305]MCP8892429.1 RES family NAD+ phosphorylase [Sphingomonas faeni]PVE50521.1 RES protein [Sphingomonas sp. TPD3009]PVE51569.1 RES protein [Arthrobacter sp. TPD3018]PVE80042.1 RES protein [Sphingomonas melonis]
MLHIATGSRHFYRCLTPKWAYLPLSGAGAAGAGGRFNRPGVEALYLSAEPETALAEYKQGSSLPRPATLAAYELDLHDVVDLSAGYDSDYWTPHWADWDCDWRWIARVEHKVPPSWKLGDEAIRSGTAGLLFPSTHQPGGTSLVIFSANLTAADRLAVHDPDAMLPRDQRSWDP